MKEYYIVAKTDGEMFIKEYERKENGSILDLYNKYIDGFITTFHPSLIVPTTNNTNILVICDDEAILKDLDLNIIGSILYGDYILGNVIIGCSGYYNGEPDIVGFEMVEEAHNVMVFLRTYYNIIDRKRIEKERKM